MEPLEARLVLASLQILSSPTATASGWAEVRESLEESVDSGVHAFRWEAGGGATSFGFTSDGHGTGGFDFSGPLTFRIVPSSPEEIGNKARLTVGWDYFASWDLDPETPDFRGAESWVRSSVSLQPYGTFFRFEGGEPAREHKGVWATADTAGFPEEEDSRRIAVIVGQTYTVNVVGNGGSEGLWLGGTDWHGDVFLDMEVSLALETRDPDLLVELEPAVNGGAELTYQVTNDPPRESRIDVHWAKVSPLSGQPVPLGDPIYSISTPAFQASDTILLSLATLGAAPQEATSLIAIADPDDDIHELTERNNRASIMIQAAYEISTEFRTDGDAATPTDTVDKHQQYSLWTTVRNQGSLRPGRITFDYQERFADDPVNLMPGLESKIGIKPVVVPTNGEKAVKLDVLRKSWEWIPDQNPFTQSLFDTVKFEELTSLFGLLQEMLTGSSKVLGAVGLGADLFTLLRGYVNSIEEVDLQYEVHAKTPDLEVVDLRELTLQVPAKYQMHFAQAALNGALSSVLKGLALETGVTALIFGWNPLAIGGVLGLAISAGVLTGVSDAAYAQAVDPPDPAYDQYALLDIGSAPQELAESSDTFSRSLVQSMLYYQALKHAEATSRDRSLGAQLAGDTVWEANQSAAASGLANAAALVQTRLLMSQDLFASLQSAADPQAFEAELEDGVPEDVRRVLAEHAGMSDSQIEELRQEFLSHGPAQLQANRSVRSFLQSEAVASIASSIAELKEVVELRTRQLSAPILQVDNGTFNRLQILQADIQSELQFGNVPTQPLLDNIEAFIREVRQAVLQTNNLRELNDQLDAAYEYLRTFQDMDSSVVALNQFVLDSRNFGWISSNVADDLEQSIDDAISDLKTGDYAAASEHLDDLLQTARAERGSGINDSTADELIGFAGLIKNTVDGANLGPELVRPPQTVRTYVGTAQKTIDFEAVFIDSDSEAPPAVMITGNTNPSLVTPTISGNTLVLNYAPGETGEAIVHLQATDSAGDTVDGNVRVIVYEAPWETSILPIDAVTVTEGETVSFFIDAAIVNPVTGNRESAPLDYFTYEVEPPLPGVASIQGHEFSWTTWEDLGGQTFDVTVEVTAHREIPEVVLLPFTITVEDVLEAPALSPVEHRIGRVGQLLSFTANAIDYDIPTEQIVFSLTNAPAGAEIDDDTGQFSWTPTTPGSYSIQLIATDGGGKSDEITVTVDVFNGPPPAPEIDLLPIQTTLGTHRQSWGTSFPVTTRVANQGPDPTGPFEVAWYLSPSAAGTENDVRLPVRNHGVSYVHDSLAADRRGNPFTVNLTLPSSPPSGWSGDRFWIHTKVDPDNALAESNESNNGIGEGHFVSSDRLEIFHGSPDLLAVSVSTPANPVDWNAMISVDTRVRNRGEADADAFQVQWYLSADAFGSNDDVLLPLADGSTAWTVAELASLATAETTVQLVLPANLESRTGSSLWVVPKIDAADQVAEADEENNFGKSGGLSDAGRLTILSPDLSGSILATQEVFDWGETVSPTVTIQNLGSLSSGAFEAQMVLSPTRLDPSDDLVLSMRGGETTVSFASIEPLFSASLQASFELPPSLPSQWDGDHFYLLVSVDPLDEVQEQSELNNLSVGEDVFDVFIADENDRRPDLRAHVSPSSPAEWGATVSVTTNISNEGDDAADAFAVEWYLSADERGSSDDVLLPLAGGGTTYDHASLPGNDSSWFDVDLSLPERPPGGLTDTQWYLVAKLDVDDDVAERIEGNNFWKGAPFAINNMRPDLHGFTPDVDLPTAQYDRRDVKIAEWGDAFAVSGVVFNRGPAFTGPFDLQWYLSEDTQFSADDVQLAYENGENSFTHSGLEDRTAGGESFFYDFVLSLPASVPQDWQGPESHLILVIDSDDDVDEWLEDNNFLTTPLFVTPAPLPDLHGTLMVADVTEAAWGDTIDVEAQIQNSGNSATTENVVVQWYLSPDEIASDDDLLLQLDDGSSSYVHQGVLEGRDRFGTFSIERFSLSELIEVTLQLPNSMPDNWQGEQFWILMRTDANDTTLELDERNNFGKVGQFADSDQLLIAEQTLSWHNSANRYDIDGDGDVIPLDVAILVGGLISGGGPRMLPPPGLNAPPPFYDVFEDNSITPHDVALLVSFLLQNNGSGEGEGPLPVVEPGVDVDFDLPALPALSRSPGAIADRSTRLFNASEVDMVLEDEAFDANYHPPRRVLSPRDESDLVACTGPASFARAQNSRVRGR